LQVAGLVQSAAMMGPQSVGQWVQGLAGPQITAQINAITKNAQFSVNLVQNAFGGFGLSGFGSAAIKGANNTVARVSVNAALSGVIGNPRVPIPDYGGNTTTIDVRKEQQDARVSAYLTAIQQGKSEEQAQNISASVGNNVGAAALARAFGTTGVV